MINLFDALSELGVTFDVHDRISLRVDITPEEQKALKHLAIERETSVPKLIAE